MIAVTWGAPDTSEPAPVITARHIIAQVAAKHGITEMMLVGQQRHKEVVAARHEAMWRCSRETRLSLPGIARQFDNRDHTTVMHGIKAHLRRISASSINPHTDGGANG